MIPYLKKLSFYRIWAVLKKEFIQLRRDKGTLGMVIFMPIMQLLIFGFAINFDPKNLPTVVLSQDNGIMARNIVTSLKNSGYFSINEKSYSEQEARALLQQGRVSFVVNIPADFSKKLLRSQNAQLLIEADAADPVAISGALGAINGAVQSAVSRDAIGIMPEVVAKPPYEVIVHRLYNPEGLSRYNIVPGLAAIVLTISGLMMTAVSLTKEKERGTMENLLSMPVQPIEVMLGKIAPYIIIGYIQATIIVSAGYFVFNVPVLGNIFNLAFCTLIFIICNLALGFTLSTFAENQMQATHASTFLFLPSILLSGYMFPFRGMPIWAQAIGSMFPSTYYIRIIRSATLKGGGFVDTWQDIWPLLLFMLITSGIAMTVYRRTLD